MAEKIPVFIPPFNKVEMVHRLLLSYAVGRAEEYDLLVDSFDELDGVRPDDFYERFYKQLGVSEEEPGGPLQILEAQRRLAAKAMQAAIQFYELNMEEIQTNAHYFNDRM